MTAATEIEHERRRVLLLVRRERDRELLADHLGEEYEVVVGHPDEAWAEFDCCLVDSAWYGDVEAELRERRQRAEPVYLPVLLLVQGDVGQALTATDGALFDDVLGLPASRKELDTRVSAALRARELSLALARERERFEALTEGASDAILTVDESGVVRYANPSVEGVLGYQPDDVVGDPLTDLLPERFHGAHESGFETYLDTGERTMDWSGIEFVGLHADGHEVPIEVSLAEFETDGERRFTGIVRDVTERKERERQFRAVFEGSFDAMVLADDVGEYVEVNEAACELFGIEREELLGRSIGEFATEESDFEASWDEFVGGEGERGEFRLVRPDGEVRTVEFAATPDIVPGRHLAVLRDVTDRKEREQELERALDQLNKAQTTADVGGWEYDLEAGTVTWTRHCYRVHGIDPGSGFEPTPGTIVELTHPEDRDRLNDALRSAIVDGDSFGVDVRIHPRGTDETRWVHAHGDPVREGDRTVLVRGVTQDITDRKLRERELESTQQRLEQAVDTTGLRVWELDSESRTITIVQRDEGSLLGIRANEFPLETFLERTHPEDRDRLRSALDAALSGEEPLNETIRAQNDETDVWRWLELTAELRTDDDRPTLVGLTRDVTEQKEREQELERVNDLLTATEELATVGSWEFHPAEEDLYWSPETYRIHGVDPDDPPTVEEAFDFYPPEDRARLEEAMMNTLETGEPFDVEVRLQPRDGGVLWVHIIGERAFVDGEPILRGAGQDITGRKERAEELERTVDLFRATQEIANVGGWEYDPEADQIQLTEESGRIYGLGPETVLDRETAISYYHPEDQPVMQGVIDTLYETGEPFDVELRLTSADGEQKWVRAQGQRVEREDGRTVLRGALQNVTERKEHERALERYETIVEAAPDPIYALDAEGRFTLVNRALAEELDRPRESLLGSEATAFLSLSERERAVSLTRTLVEEDREQGTVDLTLETRRGRREFEINVALLDEDETGGVPGTVGVARDVTELHERERHISVLDRVLRHNLRNKMNIVLGNAADIRRTGDDDVGDAATSIVEAGEELLALSDAARRFHDTIHSEEPVEETDVVEHVQHVLQEIGTEYPWAALHADLPASARARVTESFELALTEAIQNAIVHSDQDVPEVTVTVETDDDSVRVRVVDDGPGLDDLERRALERGIESPLEHTSGLGLWLVRWAVEASGGSIEISDREPRGTVVELRVPAVED